MSFDYLDHFICTASTKEVKDWWQSLGWDLQYAKFKELYKKTPADIKYVKTCSCQTCDQRDELECTIPQLEWIYESLCKEAYDKLKDKCRQCARPTRLMEQSYLRLEHYGKAYSIFYPARNVRECTYCVAKYPSDEAIKYEQKLKQKLKVLIDDMDREYHGE